VVICLERGADLHMTRLMPLPLPLTVSCSVKSRLFLPFWYRLTPIVLDKGPLNGCVYCSSVSLDTDSDDHHTDSRCVREGVMFDVAPVRQCVDDGG